MHYPFSNGSENASAKADPTGGTSRTKSPFTHRPSFHRPIAISIVALLVAALGATGCRRKSTASDKTTTPATQSAAPSASPFAGADYIAFHGGGPLTGEAGAIGAPPMKLRWKVRADDDLPAPPATAP